ncbi:uncharacterized protein LOC135193604 [Vanessa tameamea]|uniref:Uncharacterized protein LOC135193604 n=1 Tax=Vanessa tameamea TaxID=334116 RepID=A0ABM4ANG2_VANTA
MAPDVCVPPDLTQKDNKIIIGKHPPKSTNVNKTSNVMILSNEKISPSEKMSNKSKNPEVTNHDNQKTIDQNDLVSDDEMTRTIVDNNVLKDIYHTSQNYKTFVNKIFLTIGKLFKAGTIGNNTEKLSKVSDIFDNIVNLFISENDSNVEKRDQETNTDSRPEQTNIQVASKTNAEIDMQLQTMKQERKDDEENEEVAAELPEIITRAEKEPTPEKQIEIPRTEAVAQPKKPQPPTETSNSYNYDQYHNLYMAQNQPTANTNGSNLAQNTRPPCPPPAPVQNIPPGLPYSNQSYYANQEAVNKSHRYPSKRPYSGHGSPYQRYPQQGNQVPNQQPLHNQQSFYPQYLHQQNLQMQGQMFSQNTPYH